MRLLNSQFVFLRSRLALATMLTFAGATRADVVAVKSRPPLVDTRVLRLQDGKVFCRTEGGGEAGFSVEQIEYIQITGWQMFDLAEKQRRTGDWHRAASSYERALADLLAPPDGKSDGTSSAAPGDELDRALLLKCRLIQAADAQGRFERAIELYLDIIERMPAAVDALRPVHLPEFGTEWLKRADEQIDAAIARHAQDDLGRSLSSWKASWPRPTSVPVSDAQSPTRSDDPRIRGELEKLVGLIGSEHNADALERIAVLLAGTRSALRADLYYWQGRAFEADLPAVAATQPAADANAARAGLAYMRVFVHYPAHPRAAECLYRAGLLCRRSGQAEQARRLLSELVTLYPRVRGPDGSVWADKAREELKR